MPFIFLFFLTISSHLWGQTILIDPGHGGIDLGAQAMSQKVEEKNLTLLLAQKLKAKLQKKFNVYLTRSFDKTLSLDERAKIAEKVSADLFISIHFNSDIHTYSHGMETYYLDNHQNAAIHKVETVENKNEKMTEAQQILIDMVITQTVDESRKLATLVSHELTKKIVPTHQISNRGVRAGMFYVLALSKRPGLLLEVGFLSNPKELKKLTQDKFQNDYVMAVTYAIEKFFKQKKRLDS
ncbi:MAG: N-acetylmuramoyl-L-alanine amidase [Bacteriovoracaceae bacterium]|nr:N-acetylmuramoyl-L-alanine amidase [Bacteriovoracaceae bacterium]